MRSEGEQNFDEKKREIDLENEVIPREAFAGPSGYGETNYSIDGQTIDQETLGQISSDEKIKSVALIGSEFPLEERLQNVKTISEYGGITADMEKFYVAQVETLEGEKPATIADQEIIELTQAIKEGGGDSEGGQSPKETATTEDALEYLHRPGITERLSGKVKKSLAIMLSATAFAAAMPAVAGNNHGAYEQRAQQMEQINRQRAEQNRQIAEQRRHQAEQIRSQQRHQIIRYGIQRGVQEVQAELRSRMQIEQVRAECDRAIQTMYIEAESEIGKLQMEYAINLEGISLLAPDAVQRFHELNPHVTPQQEDGFTRARNAAQNANMRIENTAANCNVRMQNISQNAAYSRTMRILNSIPILVR